MRACTVHMWYVICAWCAGGVKDRVNGMRTETVHRADEGTYGWARLGLVEVPQGTPRYCHQLLEIREYLGQYIQSCACIADCSADGRLDARLAHTTHDIVVDACDGDRQLVTIHCDMR